jgi:hypothetical protein
MTVPSEERGTTGRFPVLRYETLEDVMDLEAGMAEMALDFAELRGHNPTLFQFFEDASMEHRNPFMAGLLMYRALRTEIRAAGQEIPAVTETMLRARVPSGDAEALHETLGNENPNAAILIELAMGHAASQAERIAVFRTGTMTYFLIKDAWEARQGTGRAT